MRFLTKFTMPIGYLAVAGYGALHVWTVALAYQVYGLGSAATSAAAVIFAELYFAILAWRALGFANKYTLTVVIVFAVFGAATFLYWLKNESGFVEPETE